jgi:hypothetical protein
MMPLHPKRMSSVPIDRILHATLPVGTSGRTLKGCCVVMGRGALCRIKTRGFVLLHRRRLPAFGISKTLSMAALHDVLKTVRMLVCSSGYPPVHLKLRPHGQ